MGNVSEPTPADAFWDDLEGDLGDPAIRQQYMLESQRIATIDRIINQLDDVRKQLGMSKAELARAINRTPESIRRLMTAKSANPQLSMVAELASVMGYKVTLTPMTAAERRQVSEPLRAAAKAG